MGPPQQLYRQQKIQNRRRKILSSLASLLVGASTIGCSLDHGVPVFLEKVERKLNLKPKPLQTEPYNIEITLERTESDESKREKIEQAIKEAKEKEGKTRLTQRASTPFLYLTQPTYSTTEPAKITQTNQSLDLEEIEQEYNVEYEFLGRKVRRKYPLDLSEVLRNPDAIFFSTTASFPKLSEAERLTGLTSKLMSIPAPFGGNFRTFDDEADKGRLILPAFGVMYSFQQYDLNALPDWLQEFLKKYVWNLSASYGKGSVKSEKRGLIDADLEIIRESLVAQLGLNYFPKPEGFKIPNILNEKNPLKVWLSLDTSLDYYFAAGAESIFETGLIGGPTIMRTKLHSQTNGLGFSGGASLYFKPLKELWPTSIIDPDRVTFFLAGGYNYFEKDSPKYHGLIPAPEFDFRGPKASFGVIINLP